ncbi:MAG: hypothetical protein AB4426_23415 [Xenococcaceae cyanobacterium]
MSVVLIGDRTVGKTSMIMALADSIRSQHVRVVRPSPESLRKRYGDPYTGEIASTKQTRGEMLSLQVDLPTGRRTIPVRWVDTPGEASESKNWRKKNPSAWDEIQKELSQSQGVVLLLPPPEDLLSKPDQIEENLRKTSTQWNNYFLSWLEFLKQHCSKVQHILLCMNQADLFCDFEDEGRTWQYKLQSYAFFRYNDYIREQYFSAASDLIFAYNSQGNNPRLKFFITTIYNRALLELPWIYLSSYIANI